MIQNMKDLSVLTKGAGIAFIFNIIGFGLMFLFKLIAARYFGPEQFGIYSLIETIFLFCVMIANLSLTNGIPRYVPYYKTKRQYSLLIGYLNFIIIINIISSIFFSFLLFLGSDIITSFFDFPSEFSYFLKLVAFTIPFVIFDRYLRQLFIAEKKVFWKNLSDKGTERIILFLGMLIIFLLKLDIFYLILVFILSKSLTFIIDFFIARKHIKLPKSNSSIYKKKDWLLFSLPLLFSGISGQIIGKLDHLMIGKMLDHTSLGIYSIIFSIGKFILFFQISFASIFLPIITESFAKKKNENINFIFKKSASWIFGLTLPLILIIIMYSKQLLILFYGHEYSIGYLPLIVLAIGMLINVSVGLNNQIIMLHKKTKYLFYNNIFVAILNIILNLILIPTIGILGAAIASAISIALQQIILHILARKLTNISLNWIYYLKFIISGIPAILLGGFVYRIIPFKYLSLIPSLLVYIGIYFLLLLILKTFDKEDFKMISIIEKRFNLNLKIIRNVVNFFYK